MVDGGADGLDVVDVVVAVLDAPVAGGDFRGFEEEGRLGVVGPDLPAGGFGAGLLADDVEVELKAQPAYRPIRLPARRWISWG